MHNRMLGVVELSNGNGSWVETGFCEDTQLPIYERKGDGKWAVQGKEGEGVYICADGFRNYYDEHGRYYMLKSDYLARNDPPEPEPKAEVEETPRKKAEPEFNPFAQARNWEVDFVRREEEAWMDDYGHIVYHVDYLIQESAAALSLLDWAGETSEADMVEYHLDQLMELRLTIEGNFTTEGDEEQ